ncbi:uncharacterized protein [Nicotiana tomentosiformis]|uniref:uncharacterized protein n=1 Tax=Nicotiana tomentosiformis TaxID=4098 RepID=UPI00388C614B
MPESSYRPPAIQASSNGSTGHQDETLGQQIATPRGCFECGNLGHMRRFFPRLRSKEVQQGQQPMITAPAIRPPRGRGHTSRGRPRGGGQAGGGQPAIVQPGGAQPTGAPARFYAFPARPDAVASDVMITGIISVCSRDASVLFDPGSTYSYVSYLFAHFLVISRESLGYYRRFVEGFSSIAAPLTRLTQKRAPFHWFEDCAASFQKLKAALTTAPLTAFVPAKGSQFEAA